MKHSKIQRWRLDPLQLCAPPTVQVRLECVRVRASIVKKTRELHSQARGGELIAYDALGAVSRAERIGNWLGNTFCYALHHQGPFCAALLVQVGRQLSRFPPMLPDALQCGAAHALCALLMPFQPHNLVSTEHTT